jgi:Lon protease-like protein
MAAAAALTMLLFSFEPASCFQFTSSPLLVKQPQHPSPGWNANRRRVVTAGLKQWKEEAEKTGKKELAVLPFEVPELLLPGQTRYLHFYEDRFVRLGEKAQNEHQGMLAMAFFSGSEGAMLRVCTLVQIDEYSKLDVGIGLTVRGVGRCNIDNIVGMDDFILADVSLYGDEAEEGEKNEPGHDGSAAQLAEFLFETADQLAQEGQDSGIDVSARELRQDPRSILQSGETLAQAVARVEREQNEAAKKEKEERKSGGGGSGGGAAGGGSGGEGGEVGTTPLRSRVAMARGAQTGSITMQPRNEEERDLELMLASFLGLEGAPIKDKLKAFLSQDLSARLQMASEVLEDRQKMLTARRTLRSMNLGGTKFGDEEGEGSSSSSSSSSSSNNSSNSSSSSEGQD